MMSKLKCTECGMIVDNGEYHPYAACLMYKECYDEEAVRENLTSVLEHGKQETAKCMRHKAAEFYFEHCDNSTPEEIHSGIMNLNLDA